MYKKSQTIGIKSSASLLTNNLSVLDRENDPNAKLAVVHKSLVWLFDGKDGNTKSDGATNCREVTCRGEGVHSSNSILQAKWCVLPERTVLVIAAVKGAQMFDEDGSVMIFWQALAPNPIEGLAQYARGITAAGHSYICIGMADGGILVFDVPAKGTSVRLQETLSQHDSSVADLTANTTQMASCDESGKIILWKPGGHFEVERTIDGHGYPCSSICLWDNFVIGGFGTGHIRVFDSRCGVPLAVVAAHSRWINAIDIAADGGMLVSVGEDTCLRVWKISAEPFNFEFVFQDCVTSVQLCGARFLDRRGSAFAVSGYDSQHVLVYKM